MKSLRTLTSVLVFCQAAACAAMTPEPAVPAEAPGPNVTATCLGAKPVQDINALWLQVAKESVTIVPGKTGKPLGSATALCGIKAPAPFTLKCTDAEGFSFPLTGQTLIFRRALLENSDDLDESKIAVGIVDAQGNESIQPMPNGTICTYGMSTPSPH
jgi:hypothetical protein